jgi:ribonuclease R
VRTRFSRGAQEDDQVVVRVVNWAEEEIEARVVEVLGARGDAKAQLRTVIRAQGLADEFSGEAMAEADAAPLSVVERDTQGREDLRAQACVTIDGPTAKDFDDAVFAETIDGGWRLYVHIADVSHYVKEHSALDRDAYERATSVYLLDTVLPMLPEQLSNGICSLNPGEDRLAFTCVMDIDRNSGEARDYRLARTVIRSDGRLLYDEVSAALEGDVAMRDKLAKHLPTLREMEAVAAALERRRVKRGSIDFALPEADIRLDEHGKAISIEPAQRGVANRIIEECMLMANETVAMHAANLELPFLYRVHEDPDPEKIRRFAELATNLGHKLVIGKPSVHPKHLRALLEEMEGSPEEPMLSTLMLRSLQRARYDTRNLGHFGLALRDYCHFTSPIRRYPDLFIHRVLGEHLAKGLSEERAAHYADVAAEAALHASERERAAAEAEMRYDDVKKAEYMQDKVGERFEGIIAGMSNSGLFIDLPNTVTGFTPLRAMRDDHYYYEEERYRIVGRSTKKVFRLGDRVAV